MIRLFTLTFLRMRHVVGGKRKNESRVRLTGAPDYFELAKWKKKKKKKTKGWRSLIKVVRVPRDCENERIATESLPVQLSSHVKCAWGRGERVTRCNAAFAASSNEVDEKMCS